MSYHGPFTLVTEDGSEHQVTGSLVVESDRGLQSWSGRFGDGAPYSLAGEQVTVRMPNGQEGKALITNMTVSSATGVTGELVGNGPAPGRS
jgi:hypothetical protein